MKVRAEPQLRIAVLNPLDYVHECYAYVIQPKLVENGYDAIKISFLKRLISDMALEAFPPGLYHSLADVEHFIRNNEYLRNLSI